MQASKLLTDLLDTVHYTAPGWEGLDQPPAGWLDTDDPNDDGDEDDGDEGLQFSTKAAGRWVTIGGAKGEDGKRQGGSPVYLENGRITKGHPSLTGKRIDALDEDAEPTSHRKELNRSKGHARAVLGKKARAEGVDPKHLHQLAAEVMAHDGESKKDLTAMLKQARRSLDAWGGQGKSLHLVHSRGTLDAAGVRGLDDIADELSGQYPHLFADGGHASDRLYELLTGGTPQPMTEDDAYGQAFDLLTERKQADEDRARQEDFNDRFSQSGGATAAAEQLSHQPQQPPAPGAADDAAYLAFRERLQSILGGGETDG